MINSDIFLSICRERIHPFLFRIMPEGMHECIPYSR